MRRISVFEVDGRWTFAPGADASAEWSCALDAANSAVAYGKSLVGVNAGFIIRLVLPTPNANDTENMVLYTHVFSVHDAGGSRVERAP